ncbi:ABC transporter permease [Oleiagrimonas sp. C23AA]|uniref:ABC transporter permease n=1 Tax=Oleiagrimonas sp. C23AA TaxID=2719047 RepID=UPI0014217428|nr:ABC transporter permease [Oleiagrimonas sp. C23AA]NII12041.1 FtsX-like permease family protein [Oleiagrimonas sp. C23AA]
MFAYYVDLAWRSLRRSRGLTILMVLAIGFGVAASMTTFAVFRAASGDPIPWKSGKLFVPQIDSAGPGNGNTDNEPPQQLTYPDAMALMRDHRAVHQSAMYRLGVSVVPDKAGAHPFNVDGHAVFAGFFPMLDVPFAYGSAWSHADDQHRAAVVVISSHLNDKLFGGGNSVGRSINIEGKNYRVVGVTDHWDPKPMFYDVVNTGGFTTQRDDVLIPLPSAIDANITNQGTTNCSRPSPEPGFVGLQHSTCVWIAYMAELDSTAQVSAYKRYLDNYARSQQQAGRYDWPPNNRLRSLPQWLDYMHVVPSDTKVSLLVALGLFVVCLVNTAGLLLAKLTRRSGEIGVRRAIGAPRRAIYAQFVIEAGMVGLTGGVLGMVLTALGVLAMRVVLPPEIADLARLNVGLFALTVLVAMAATVLAGLYPSFRAANVQPAWHLKSH